MAYNMTIQTISKEDKNVTVELSADDLVMICNALYLHSKEQDLQSKEQKTNDHFLQLYSDMMIAPQRYRKMNRWRVIRKGLIDPED